MRKSERLQVLLDREQSSRPGNERQIVPVPGRLGVDFLDHLVTTRQAPSRAAVIARSLERDPDLDGLAEYVATAPLGID